MDTSFSGADSAAFCALARSYKATSKNLGSAATPDQLRANLDVARTAINQALVRAPGEIKPDVAVLARAFSDLFDAFQAANFDAGAVSPTALAKLETPEFQAATVRFEAYLHTVCGVTGQ